MNRSCTHEYIISGVEAEKKGRSIIWSWCLQSSTASTFADLVRVGIDHNSQGRPEVTLRSGRLRLIDMLVSSTCHGLHSDRWAPVLYCSCIHVRTYYFYTPLDRSIDHCRCSKIHMYSEFRSCMHYSLICSSLALLAMDRSMHDSSVRPPGMLPTCMLLGGSKNTWKHACMCMGRINNKWPCTGLHEIHPRPQQPGTVRTLLLVMIM